MIVDQPITTTNGESSTSSSTEQQRQKLTPAQQRQLEADAQSTQATPSSPRHRRKQSVPPNLNSEGDFPALGSGPKPTTAKPVSWGARRPAPSATSMPSSLPTTTNHNAAYPSLNGVNGRGSSTAESSRASTPAPTPRVVAVTKSIPPSLVTENVPFKKNQLATPNAKDFTSICEKITKFSGVEKISVSRMKVAEIVTFTITGKPENVIKARNRLQNEVGIKVSPQKKRADVANGEITLSRGCIALYHWEEGRQFKAYSGLVRSKCQSSQT